MKVRALRNGDIDVNGRLVALFEGQIYDVAEPLVQEHDWLAIVEAKAVELPADKAVRPRRNKSIG